MPAKYLRDQRHDATVAEIASLKFPYPDEQHPELETLLNEPEPSISVGDWERNALYPDIVVVRRPGQWLQLMAEVETADTVSDESARERWLPYSKMGDLLLYVPAGYVQEATTPRKVDLRGPRERRARADAVHPACEL